MKFFKEPETVYAHCDIPCGIYSPHPSAMAAETVERMVTLLLDLQHPDEGTAGKEEWLAYKNSANRFIAVKEAHADLCKREVLILWSDYFKPEHLSMFPDLHEKIWQTVKLCSKNKQQVSLELARELRAKVAEIGEMFQKTKEKK